jgi:alanyl-tRNA synthetase
MTERIYYTDAYTIEFEARVAERLEEAEGLSLILDRTCFYPTSGGQLYDTGIIEGVQVQDVYVREKDDAIVHVLENDIKASAISGKINWRRRFDHMQQHSGQHILSQALVQTANAETVSFHMGAESCTIDLNRILDQDELGIAERLANDIVRENRVVAVRMVSRDELTGLPLRKPPATQSPMIRLVEIFDFDLSACGGTHVATTAEIGIIKIIGSERRGEGIRVEFLCGGRALDDYRKKDSILAQLSADFTTGYWELPKIISQLKDESREFRRQIKALKKYQIIHEAENLLSQSIEADGISLVSHIGVESDIGQLRQLAKEIVNHPKCMAMLGVAGFKSMLIFARSDDVQADMNELLKETLPMLGQAKGGGSAKFAQGGGPSADRQQISAAINYAKNRILKDMNSNLEANYALEVTDPSER